MCSVVLVPGLAICSVLALRVRLLMVRFAEGVALSMVTVLLPALVRRSAESSVDGATKRDQLLLDSHLPLPPVQLLPAARAVRVTAMPSVIAARVLIFILASPSEVARIWIRGVGRPVA